MISLFLAWALGGSEWSHSRPDLFASGEIAHFVKLNVTNFNGVHNRLKWFLMKQLI
jgi:hypothetical protein